MLSPFWPLVQLGLKVSRIKSPGLNTYTVCQIKSLLFASRNSSGDRIPGETQYLGEILQTGQLVWDWLSLRFCLPVCLDECESASNQRIRLDTYWSHGLSQRRRKSIALRTLKTNCTHLQSLNGPNENVLIQGNDRLGIVWILDIWNRQPKLPGSSSLK